MDQAVADFVAAQCTYRVEVGFGFDYWNPGDAVVEHGGCGCEGGVFEGDVDASVGDEFA